MTRSAWSGVARGAVVIAAGSVLACGQGSTPEGPQAEAGAPIFDNLGTHHVAITATPEAHRYFNQGFTLSYAFNHAEAIRSFREAARLDPQCAMC